MIKLGRAARLWNGPSMEEWGKISKQNQNGLRTNALNKLADGVLTVYM